MKIFSVPEIHQLKQEHFKDLDVAAKKPVYEFFKRILDFIFASVVFLLLLPFWLFIVIAIRLDSPGGAIFTHTRIGKNGKSFTLYKFRTMYQGVADQELAPQTPKDKRITRVGRFLRKTSLDELPQLMNIIKGEMSMVGPRPEMGFIVEKYTPLERKRLLVKPGLTGLWQIMGRKDLPLHHNLEYDFYYIQHRSFALDFMIILKTFGVVISGRGAY